MTEDSRACPQVDTSLLLERHALDHIDVRIMFALQEDARISNVDLSKAVGLSPPPTLRRTKTLEDRGYIQRYTAKLDAKRLGFEVNAFVFVGLTSQASVGLLAFEQQVQRWATVRECYVVSGGTDFLLKCVARDLEAFQSFVKHTLMTAPMVVTVKTSMVFRTVKNASAVPLSLVDTEAPAVNRKLKRPSAALGAR